MSEKAIIIAAIWAAVAITAVAEAAWHRTVDAAVIMAVVAALTTCSVA